MHKILNRSRIGFVVAMWVALAGAASASDIKVTLSGNQEVPAVATTASGSARFKVKDDLSISGSVKTTGIKAVAAHIHEGAAGVNGAVAIALAAQGDGEWIVPAGAKLTAAQMDGLKAGNLYVNVHSDAHKGGEIRAQLKK